MSGISALTLCSLVQCRVVGFRILALNSCCERNRSTEATRWSFRNSCAPHRKCRLRTVISHLAAQADAVQLMGCLHVVEAEPIFTS